MGREIWKPERIIMSTSINVSAPQRNGNYIPLSLLTKNLEHCSVKELSYFLYNLRSDNYITQDITINDYTVLINKLIKMLNGQAVFDSWKALQVINVLFTYNPIVLCSFSKTIIKELGNKLEFIFKKQRLNSTNTSKEYFKSLMFTINNLISILRNKPVLKREVLTPNLSPIIKIMIQKLPEITDLEIVETFINFLQDLLVKNTSIFKPYVNKYYEFVTSKLSEKSYLQDKFFESFSFCHLINLNYQTSSEKNSGNSADLKHVNNNTLQVQWSSTINSIFAEFKKLFSLYEDILDVDESTTALIAGLASIDESDESPFKFLPLLNLDLNEANTLFQINARMNLFVDILKKFITLPTPFQIKFNVSHVVTVATILASLQNFKLLKGLRKDTNVISCLSLNLISLGYDSSLPLLQSLLELKEGSHMLPFSDNLLPILQNFLIPLYNGGNKNKTFNLSKVMGQKLNVMKLFKFLTALSQSCQGILISDLKGEDFEIWNGFLTLAITVLKKDQSLYFKLQNYSNTIHSTKNVSEGKKKTNLLKKTDTISDIYTVPQAFCSSETLEALNKAVFDFLIESVKHIRITTNVRTLIEKQAIFDGNQILMKWLVVNPSLESSNQSILPIVSSLANSDTKDWLKSIIIPKLPQNFIQKHFESSIEQISQSQISETNDFDDNMWIENEEEVNSAALAEDVEDEEEPPSKKKKLNFYASEAEKTDIVVETTKDASIAAPLVIEKLVQVQEIIEPVSEADEVESDLEIPELDLT